ncbi:signal peptidase I [Enterococcus sp. AZ126]|uniref:signal peptidase I n=1 Tax=Enterococcus sp. AZ126 TaxID=2774635 RepID=UPI003F22FEC5
MKLMIRVVSILTISTLIFLCLFNIKFSVKKVGEYSMSPSLSINDIALFEKGDHELKRFDIVLMKQNSTYSIRRVIGLPGENIRYKNDILYVNGKEQSELFIRKEISESELAGGFFTEDFTLYDLINKMEIPNNQYLVLNDNRFFKNDSRRYGLIESSDIKGVLKSNFSII